MFDFKIFFEPLPGINLALLPDLTIVAVSDTHLLAAMTKCITGKIKAL